MMMVEIAEIALLLSAANPSPKTSLYYSCGTPMQIPMAQPSAEGLTHAANLQSKASGQKASEDCRANLGFSSDYFLVSTTLSEGQFGLFI